MHFHDDYSTRPAAVIRPPLKPAAKAGANTFPLSKITYDYLIRCFQDNPKRLFSPNKELYVLLAGIRFLFECIIEAKSKNLHFVVVNTK